MIRKWHPCQETVLRNFWVGRIFSRKPPKVPHTRFDWAPKKKKYSLQLYQPIQLCIICFVWFSVTSLKATRIDTAQTLQLENGSGDRKIKWEATDLRLFIISGFLHKDRLDLQLENSFKRDESSFNSRQDWRLYSLKKELLLLPERD